LSSTNFEIKSDWLECETSTQRLMAFLSDIQHLESILPKDKIKNFQVLDKDKIRFDIENIITLTLHITPIHPSSPHSDKSLKSNPLSLFNAIQYTSEPFGNYYLILKEYAFGVTRIIEKAQAVPIPFAPDTPLNKGDQFRRLSEYSGVIVAAEGSMQQHYYVYNTYCVTLPKTARVVKQDRKNEEKEHIRELKNKYVIVGNTFAMPLSNVLNILSADVVTPFKTEEWDGFVDYNKIIPVKNIDTGKFVVITQNIAYRTSRVAISDGNILRKETSNETYLETPVGIYKILEQS